MTDIRRQLHTFRKILKENADPGRAIHEKKYLKSPFKFFGTSVPFMDKMAKEFKRSNRDAGQDYIVKLVKTLWDSDYHDEKRLGIRILQYYPEHLDLSVMPVLEGMLMQSTGWDHVDDISIHLVGAALEKDKRAYFYLRRWSKNERQDRQNPRRFI